ncbi:MAG: thioredoxin [Lachnospiraceae bacterium]|nr:thioredoxin [Lachnospiraceae bacterium]
MAYKFTTANFEKEVLESEVPVVVDFYADWCGPCKMMGPVVDKLAQAFEGKVKIGKVNVDEDVAIAQKYRVASIPTFVFFKDGQVAQTAVGAMSAAALEEKINSLL